MTQKTQLLTKNLNPEEHEKFIQRFINIRNHSIEDFIFNEKQLKDNRFDQDRENYIKSLITNNIIEIPESIKKQLK